MNLFRIAKPKFARDLSGTSARLFGGRWNPAGKAVVYTAGSSALCLIEHLTHLSRTDMELTFQLMLIETYKTPITFLEDHFPKLPVHRKNDQALTKAYGKQWLEKQYSPILRVPSLHSPWEYNYLFNPVHSELDVEIVDTSYYIYDAHFIEKQ